MANGLLSVRQAAKFLDYHPQTVRDLARRGIIPAVKRRVKWFFDPDQLKQWLKLNEAANGLTKKDIQDW